MAAHFGTTVVLGKTGRMSSLMARAIMSVGLVAFLLTWQLKANRRGEATEGNEVANAKLNSAQIISQALCTFPPDTEFIEYDHVNVLRDLPSYDSLRRKLDERDIEQLSLILRKLDIDVKQIEEEVVGMSDTSSFYGLISGSLVQSPSRNANIPSIDPRHEGRIFCPGERICVVFFSDSLAAFADLTELRRMIDTRHSYASGRSSRNSELTELLKNTVADAPVRGAVMGGQLDGVIQSLFADVPSIKSGIAAVRAGVIGIAYAARFDSTAHVTGMLACNSRPTALFLTSAVSGARVLSQRNVQVRTPAGNIALQNLKLASSGPIVTFKLDTPVSIDP